MPEFVPAFAPRRRCFDDSGDDYYMLRDQPQLPGLKLNIFHSRILLLLCVKDAVSYDNYTCSPGAGF